ncbi:TetR family transcriptional regulator C-terminal domain-containing protein [Paenibacillus sp. MMS20-IR301]|uniref:TetR/AcrR family transcriptional regulator n=1 Tax=Paenibacillus sp. MMS20-IR301 TaxID=2895946 RepID=UPI0028EF157D|nr:TetR family transcriptional regulator C-terminal domain-containing protein [Paenibacillus sp. MMS20-IR301]WNS45647.1 TetR family transcriptional regulator C-terminal domain-containing protein [Paenibacillus sp. MMS20-IR301]
MPKIVDHDERRNHLAEAAWRIIRRDGLEAVSVRNVAREAGMSLGSLRHYFASQFELLAFSMRLVSEKVYRRTGAFESTGNPRQDVERLIHELMPIDEERRAEAEVWLAFVGRAAADPAIQALKREVHHGLYSGFCQMLEYLDAVNLLRKDLDLQQEIKRLHALVDGLVVHSVIHPELVTPEDMISLIAGHLDKLMA